jgi:transposase
MTAPLSRDMRDRIVRTVAAGSSARAAAGRFEVSPSAAIKLMQRMRATGSTAPAKIGGYRRPLLAGREDYIRALTAARKGITLEEIRADLAEHGIAVSKSAIWTMLRRLGLSHKKRR